MAKRSVTPTPLPSQELLRELLDYDPATGALTWRPRPASMFPATRGMQQRFCDSWNTKFAGKPALSAPLYGHLHGCIFGKFFLSHRVIWKMVHGTEPEQIDHENGIRSDNRICNLVASTPTGNARNKRLLTANTSGHCGVSWKRDKLKWKAYISVDGKQIHLGYYSEIADAMAARDAANTRYGFHANHGRKVSG